MGRVWSNRQKKNPHTHNTSSSCIVPSLFYYLFVKNLYCFIELELGENKFEKKKQNKIRETKQSKTNKIIEGDIVFSRQSYFVVVLSLSVVRF